MRRNCRHEEVVRAAAGREDWTPELRSHVASCPTCADVALVTAVLRDRRPAPIVARDANVLWVCAKQARRLVTEARLSLAMMATTTIAVTVVLAVLLSFVDWRAAWTMLGRQEVAGALLVVGIVGTLLVTALIRTRRTDARGRSLSASSR